MDILFFLVLIASFTHRQDTGPHNSFLQQKCVLLVYALTTLNKFS